MCTQFQLYPSWIQNEAFCQSFLETTSEVNVCCYFPVYNLQMATSVCSQISTNLNNSLHLPSRHFPLNKTLCSKRNFDISSFDVKFISLDTALHLSIFLGTLAAKKKPGLLLLGQSYNRL